MKASGIGGQAVMEGIMMKNGETYAVAVRKPDNEIIVKQDVDHSYQRHEKIRKIPFVRGVFNFIDSLVLGMTTLTYSAEFYEEEEEPSKFDMFLTKILGGFGEKVIMGATVALSIILAVAIFMVCPFLLAKLFERFIVSQLLLSLLEGGIRVGILLGYIWLISKIDDIQRVFMYHGAEHKCINCIENGMELNVENVMKSSKEHKRCGTSFLLVVMLVSIIFFLFIRVDSAWLRLGLRILLVPVIAGVSYEFIRLAGKSENKLVDILSKPGMMLQGLTTREPDESMVEVAIRAVEAVFDWEAFLEENKDGVKVEATKNVATLEKKEDKEKKNSSLDKKIETVDKKEETAKQKKKNKKKKATTKAEKEVVVKKETTVSDVGKNALEKEIAARLEKIVAKAEEASEVEEDIVTKSTVAEKELAETKQEDVVSKVETVEAEKDEVATELTSVVGEEELDVKSETDIETTVEKNDNMSKAQNTIVVEKDVVMKNETTSAKEESTVVKSEKISEMKEDAETKSAKEESIIAKNEASVTKEDAETKLVKEESVIEKTETLESNEVAENKSAKEESVITKTETNSGVKAVEQEDDTAIPEYAQREKKEETPIVATPVAEDNGIMAPRLTFVDDSEPGVIKLHWDKVKKVSGYVVYRKAEDEVYKMYPDIKKNYFEDRDIEPRTIYYYRVRAYVMKNNKQVFGQMSLIESNGYNARVKSKY